MKQIKVMEQSSYYIAGQFAIYRVLGGYLSMLGWLKEYSDIDQVITTVNEKVNFVIKLMGCYQTYINDIKWPHK